MTEDELREIEARAEQATPGPWSAEDGQLLDQHDLDPILSCCNIDEGTLAFIAAARQDVPRLIAEIRRLRAALESRPD